MSPIVDFYNLRIGRSVPLTELDKEWQCHRQSSLYTPRSAVQIGFSQGVVGSPGYMQRRYGSLQDSNNAWEFAITFDMKAHFWYPVYHEENSYTGAFLEWHAKSDVAIKAA